MGKKNSNQQRTGQMTTPQTPQAEQGLQEQGETNLIDKIIGQEEGQQESQEAQETNTTEQQEQIEETQPPIPTPVEEKQAVVPTAAPVEPPVAIAPVVTNAQPEQAAPDADFKQMTENLMLKGTSEQKYIISVMRGYIDAMKPGKRIMPEEGAKQQYGLWRLLFTVIHNHPRDQFKGLWQLVLAYFNEYGDGVLGDDFIYRFSEAWKYNANELKAFQRILDLIRLTANSATASVGLKQYDFKRGLSIGFTEDGVGRLVNFYKR